MAHHRVARLRDIPAGSRRLVCVRGVEILVFNVDGSIYATGRYCPHEEVELDRATLDGCSLTCWEHGYELLVDTGVCATDPTLRLPTFPVLVDQGEVYVEL